MDKLRDMEPFSLSRGFIGVVGCAVLAGTVMLAWPDEARDAEGTRGIVVVPSDGQASLPRLAPPLSPTNPPTAIGILTADTTVAGADSRGAFIKFPGRPAQRFEMGAEVFEGFRLTYVGERLVLLESLDGRRVELTIQHSGQGGSAAKASLSPLLVASIPKDDEGP